MIPKIIHQVWVGGLVPEKLQQWMKTVRELNPEWEYRLWDEPALEEHGYRVESMKEQLDQWASVSNTLRLLLLARFGGIYLDCDFECLKPLNTLPEYGAIAALQDTDRICNAFMGAPPQHPWIRWQIRHFLDYDQRDPASGVYLASAAPREGLTLVETHKVYPFPHDAAPEKRVPHRHSILIHHWEGSWAK